MGNFWAFLKPLLLTLLLECPIVFFFFRKQERTKLVLSFILINVITNLSLNLSLFYRVFRLFGLPLSVYLLIAEVLIIIIEAFLYRYQMEDERLLKCFWVSFAANVFSFLMGLLIYG